MLLSRSTQSLHFWRQFAFHIQVSICLFLCVKSSYPMLKAILLLMSDIDIVCSCTGVSLIIFISKRCQSHVFLHKYRSWSNRIPAQTNESVELLGKEHSSDQCHMMQEMCQHFSSSSLAIGRGMYSLSASNG